MSKKVLQPKAWIPRGPYSLGTQVGNMVFISGQISQDNDGKAIGPGDAKAQTRVVIEKMQLILAEAGMTLDDVVSTTVYLQDLADYAAMNAVYIELFKKDFPARATVRADLAGEGLLVEIAGIAVKA
ncbi:RidA family protein [Vineibacter terrae]|uniref:RidA family protein n=1 Tax=Vineibacter terrae TaxID=2586908 RepID=A0A5C8P8G1_9HYPH|nr:RidA family protein [Vineibacter terrae]TXL70062.1 RidA family protein [Vineibacter terrae]